MRLASVALLSCLAACAASADHTSEAASELVVASPVELPASPPEGSGAPVPATLVEGLDHLRTGLRQQQDWQLWDQVAPSTAAATSAFLVAADQGAPPARVRAGIDTSEVLGAWNALYLESLEVDPDDPAAALRNADLALRLDALLEQLAGVEGRLPHTSYLLADMQFLSGDDDGGSLTLQYALEKWPGDDDLHALTRAWRDVLPDPDAIIAALDRAASRHVADGGVRARALATRAHLNLSMGNTDYGEGRLEQAAARYRSAGDDFIEAYATQFVLSLDEADLLAAQGYTYAGWSEYNLADGALEAGDTGLARQHISDAGENFALALSRVPGHEDATRGVDFTGDFLVSPAKLGDMQAAAAFFGDMARRFDNGVWWNNAAFFLRETAADPDPAVAQANYEACYRAYERCIALEPDNARFVNDTALILVHYIEPLDPARAARAEELLRRAWALGAEVCDNPFTSQEKHDENFEAYGDAMYNLGVLLARLGRADEAREVTDELLAVAPHRLDARQLHQALASPAADSP